MTFGESISKASMPMLFDQYRWLKRVHEDGIGVLQFSISIEDNSVRISSPLSANKVHPINKDAFFVFDRTYTLESKEEK